MARTARDIQRWRTARCQRDRRGNAGGRVWGIKATVPSRQARTLEQGRTPKKILQRPTELDLRSLKRADGGAGPALEQPEAPSCPADVAGSSVFLEESS